MGKPTKSHFLVLPAEYIGRIEVTGGTETSKYPEEEKSNEIPLVVASERGYRTNRQLRKRWQIVLDGNRRNNGIWRGKFYLYAAGRGSLKINILTTI